MIAEPNPVTGGTIAMGKTATLIRILYYDS